MGYNTEAEQNNRHGNEVLEEQRVRRRGSKLGSRYLGNGYYIRGNRNSTRLIEMIEAHIQSMGKGRHHGKRKYEEWLRTEKVLRMAKPKKMCIWKKLS